MSLEAKFSYVSHEMGSCNTFSSSRHFVAKILASTTKSLTSKQEHKILYCLTKKIKIKDVILYKVASF